MITSRLFPPFAFASFVLTLVVTLLAGCGQDKSKTQIHYETARLERGAIVARVSASGTLSALVTVQVGSQVSGRIQTLSADFNSVVQKGQVLATLDPALFDAALANARANVSAAQANLGQVKVQAEFNRIQYQRQSELAQRGIVGQADLDSAKAAYDVSRAQVSASEGALEQARAALNQAEINLSYTHIVSPINGVVISRNVDIGQTVAASLQAPTLFVLAEDLRRMQVDTSVAEADVGRLREGLEATFTVDAFPGEKFKGVVRQVRNNATTLQNVVTYDAVIDVRNPDLKLRPGMTANVTLVIGERHDILVVPNSALRFRPPDGLLRNADGAKAGERPKGGGAPRGKPGARSDERMLWVLQDQQLKPVRVQVGLSDGSRTEVASNELQEGAQVVTDVSGLPPRQLGFRPL